MRRALGLLAFALVISPVAVPAQQPPNPAGRDRAALEQQFRERTAQVTRQRLGLSDPQMEQLEQINRRFAPQLSQLATQERETRRELRREMMADKSANQQHVSDLLDTALRIQKQRVALIETEQKELARFLTPLQRARYIALQAQFRARAEQLARQNPRMRPRRR